MGRFFFLLTLFVGLSSASAHAQASRTFVSSQGSDSNACSRAAPCRTFAGAIAKTSSGGEIDVLDSAGYGAFNIDRAISIVNEGGSVAGVQAAAGATAITINAGASDAVYLSGLTIEGAGAGGDGVQFHTGASLTLVNSVIRHFVGDGVDITPSSAPMTFDIADTRVSDNGGVGVFIVPQGSASGAKGNITRVAADNNQYGVYIDGENAMIPVIATIADSTIANNKGAGLALTSSFNGTIGTTANAILRNSTLSNNAIGFSVSAFYCFLLLNHSSFVANTNLASIPQPSGPPGGYSQVNTNGDNSFFLNGPNIGITELNSTPLQ